jgi:DNA polymerase beta
MCRSLVPWKARGAALLALTGDIEFNKDIRMKASKLGMHLNEFGLWRWQPNGPGESEPEADEDGNAEQKGFWELVKADTEEDILAELGMDWIEPTKRNFGFVLGKQPKKRTKSKVVP